MPTGIPSYDTFSDVLAWLNYAAVERIFAKWVSGIKEVGTPESVAIDGKTILRSSNALHKAAHIVTAYSSDLELILRQVVTKG